MLQLSGRFLRSRLLRNWNVLSMSSAVDEPLSSKLPKSSSQMMTTLDSLNFDNLALRDLPVDPVSDNRQRQVRGACFSRVSPTSVQNPRLVVYSASAMALLGLPESELLRPEFAEFFSGNLVFPGSEPAAHCYCGHQFGSFAGQLGDGATMYLGEVVNDNGERWELQLKGAGKTPYSRTADGRKVLRSSIREFLCSEAMFHLNVPTTRAGSCITSDSTVVRDIHYDGHPIHEKCTIISRIAPTFIRFGSFQISKGPDRETGQEGPSAGQPQIVQQLTNYVIKTFYQQIWMSHYPDHMATMYIEFFKEVVKRTASLVAHWQCVGFCHGVLNTDNMHILGLTIDYGPYGFLDRYDPNHICNASDDGGRYTYGKQPEICKWNCSKLAEALQAFAPLDELLAQLELFDAEYQRCYLQIMRKKLGLLKVEQEADSELINLLFETMEKTGADFTNTFRCLSRLSIQLSRGGPDDVSVKIIGLAEVHAYLLDQCATVEELKASLIPNIDPRQMAMLMSLFEANPQLVMRMGKAYQQIAVEIKKREKLDQLEELSAEMKTKQDHTLWCTWLDKYVKRLEIELVDVEDIDNANKTRKSVMDSTNPRIILRNYVAQSAIEAAEHDDFSEVRRVLSLLQHPFDDVTVDEQMALLSPSDTAQESVEHNDASTRAACSRSYYDGKPPSWATALKVT